MKILLLIPAMCLMCFSCNSNGSNNNNGTQEEEHTSDWSITMKVKAEIMSSGSISASARFVSVSTTNGVVTLTGNVSTQEDSDKIVDIARNVHGVVNVDNQIIVLNN